MEMSAAGMFLCIFFYGLWVYSERFATMPIAFEEEWQQLKDVIPDMEQYLKAQKDKTDSLQQFIDRVKRVMNLTELTLVILHEFIKKIVVSKPEYVGGYYDQSLDIYYSGIVSVRELTSEEMEKTF